MQLLLVRPAEGGLSHVTTALSQCVPGVRQRRPDRRLSACHRVRQPGSRPSPRHGEGQHGDKVCLGAVAAEPLTPDL